MRIKSRSRWLKSDTLQIRIYKSFLFQYFKNLCKDTVGQDNYCQPIIIAYSSQPQILYCLDRQLVDRLDEFILRL